MKEEFKPSEHQQNIYDFIENGTQNGVVKSAGGFVWKYKQLKN